ncbi:MAG: Plug domain-containing protein, partial [Sphingomonadales bacterium]|nr:Plug domain-containing protein [Sphingomonadales bacterium]
MSKGEPQATSPAARPSTAAFGSAQDERGRKASRAILATLLFSAATPALAQDEPENDPIVVTAAGLEEPRSDVAYGSVSLDAEEIAREPSGRLENILSQVAGVELFRASDSRSGHPTGQGVTLRGLGGNASSRALLVLDGVPQSDPFGGWIAWPGFDAEQLGEIRVVRGGGSGVYGPGALAGTIELTSLSVENFQPGRA